MLCNAEVSMCVNTKMPFNSTIYRERQCWKIKQNANMSVHSVFNLNKEK